MDNLKYNDAGTERLGSVIGSAGLGLIVSIRTDAANGLSGTQTRLVMVHEAVDRAEWSRLYEKFGGEQLFYEDGTPV